MDASEIAVAEQVEGPSSLVSLRISLPKQEKPSSEGISPVSTPEASEDRFHGVDRCPRKVGWSLLNVETGEVVPARCRANFCSFCGPLNARLVSGALAMAGPERAFTLTQVGDTWQERRRRMYRFNYCVRQRLGRNDWAWHVEPNPKATGHHVHGWQRGDFLEQKELSKLADRCGMGRVVWISRMDEGPSTGTGYGMKLMGITYGLKGALAEEEMHRFLDANGRRLVHTSRGFFPEGQRAAMREFARSCGDVDPDEASGCWVLMAER